MSLLNFNFAVVYTNHKFVVSLKNHSNYLKDNIFEFF